MVGRGAPEPKRSWRADKTLLARQAHRSENPPASAVGSVKVYHIATQNAIHFAKKFPMGGLDFLFWFCYHKNEECSTMYYQGGKNELFD